MFSALFESPKQNHAMIIGENGHAEYSAAGLGDSLLAFFDNLVRGLEEDQVRHSRRGA